MCQNYTSRSQESPFVTLGLDRESEASDVCSCNLSFHYPCRSCASYFQHRRARGYIELWVVPRKCNWRSSRIPGNAVCCTTVCILPNSCFRRYFDEYFLESLRFAPATLPLEFSGVRQATSFGAACPQQAITVPGGSVNFSALLISEDCRSATCTYYLSNFFGIKLRSFYQCRQTCQYPSRKETAGTFCKISYVNFCH